VAEIRGTISDSRADRIIHHLAECLREIQAEPGLDAWDMGEFGLLLDAAKDTVNRRRQEDETAPASPSSTTSRGGADE
jgi:hypothetical protein